MARAIEPALRIRLSPSVDAFVARSGVHLRQGSSAFFLDARAARKLADLYSEIEAQGFDGALRAVLPSQNGRPTETSPRASAARERG